MSLGDREGGSVSIENPRRRGSLRRGPGGCLTGFGGGGGGGLNLFCGAEMPAKIAKWLHTDINDFRLNYALTITDSNGLDI